MDNSLEYKKMCNCDEIQNKWFVSIGDYYHSMREDGVVDQAMIDILKFVPGGPKRLNKEAVWLPRQGQLQDMLIYYSTGERFRRFWYFITHEYTDWSDFISPEILWLSFVMKENYHKIWDEKECRWVNQL